ncbi:amidohydrolase [Bordetella sp. BOR01]|uniref:amidohydrolase family protein n=1 Tax=Bordetella sp. BOR01 TaxID=2854779 RepID=UPI001C46C06F|nr:amidohydrolase family protein [Bordetella sp. BOR01]MBV7486569.1 amidohydrolase family protein [Bordetella sp. BOR01]
MPHSSGRDRLEPDPAPDDAPHPPRSYTLPAGAVDTHAHVIGTQWIEHRSYTPHPAPPAAYLSMLDATGMSYGVLIQVSVHGTDNSLLRDTVKANLDRLRGIAVIPHDLGQADLRDLKDAGIVGLRLNTTTGGGVGVDALADYEAICREMGWHLQFLVNAEQLPALAPRIARLRVPAVFDHMGYVSPDLAGTEAGHTLLQLVRDGAWVKLSGGFRISLAAPPYPDVIPFARALAEAAPTRCVWGSDWPHVSFGKTMPNTGDLLDLLGHCVPDAALRDAVLANNPQRLYGFAATGSSH